MTPWCYVQYHDRITRIRKVQYGSMPPFVPLVSRTEDLNNLELVLQGFDKWCGDWEDDVEIPNYDESGIAGEYTEDD